jgi:hypothetical protein
VQKYFYIIAVYFLLFGEVDAQFFSFGRNKVQYTQFDWHVLKTEHFDVYYYPEMEELVRVNLRPFRDATLPLRSLSRAVYFTAKELKQDTVLFRRRWQNVLELMKEKKISMEERDLSVINDAFLSKGFIFPMHHSWEYQQANSSSYRVVKRSWFEKLCRK